MRGRTILRFRRSLFLRDVHPAWARLLYVLVYIVGTALLVPGLLLEFHRQLLVWNLGGDVRTPGSARDRGDFLAFGLARALGPRSGRSAFSGGRLRLLDQRAPRAAASSGSCSFAWCLCSPSTASTSATASRACGRATPCLPPPSASCRGRLCMVSVRHAWAPTCWRRGFAWSDLAMVRGAHAVGAVGRRFMLSAGAWLAKRTGLRR